MGGVSAWEYSVKLGPTLMATYLQERKQQEESPPWIRGRERAAQQLPLEQGGGNGASASSPMLCLFHAQGTLGTMLPSPHRPHF